MRGNTDKQPRKGVYPPKSRASSPSLTQGETPRG